MGFFSKAGGGDRTPVNIASFENGAIRVKKGVIQGIRVEQNCRIAETATGEPHDVAVRITVGYGGENGWTREEYIGGWLKREKTAHGYGPPVDLGNAWGVVAALRACGVDLNEAEIAAGVDLSAEFSLENVVAVLEEGVDQVEHGDILYLLDYVKGTYNGKPSYGTWRTLENLRSNEEEEDVADRLYNRWQDQRAKGYAPKNFKPEVMTEFASGESSSNGVATPVPAASGAPF